MSDTPASEGSATAKTAATPAAVPENDGSGHDRSTHFVFEHKVFGVEGAKFAISPKDSKPAFYVTLGDLQVAISLTTLLSEFDIDAESPDLQLLDTVEKGLKYVREIRPNDSIPRELLDGSASWTLEPKHYAVAKSRLTIQVASWATGSELVVVEASQLLQIEDDPATRERVQRAFEELAERLGLGRERKQEIVDKIDVFARELAYIEALRDRFACILEIESKLKEVASIYRRDRGFLEELQGVQRLIRTPITQFEEQFQQVDAQTGEILALLRNIKLQVDFVRGVRDLIHAQLMFWDELILKWQEMEIRRAPVVEALCKETYRFLAQRFLVMKPWPLSNQAKK